MKQVLIAVRGGPQAKQRLAGCLPPPAREALVAAMLQAMLDALRPLRRELQCWVVTPTAVLGTLAAAQGAHVLWQPGGAGLNAAFDLGRRHLAQHAGDGDLLLLPGDLPLLDAIEVQRLFQVLAACDIALVRSADGGTGALALRAPIAWRSAWPTAFGTDSHARHAAQAHRAGWSVASVGAPSLALDIDRPQDLHTLRQLADARALPAALAHCLAAWPATAAIPSTDTSLP